MAPAQRGLLRRPGWTVGRTVPRPVRVCQAKSRAFRSAVRRLSGVIVHVVRPSPVPGRPFRPAPIAVGILLAAVILGCEAGPPVATPPIVAGSPAAPREVNLITRDYAFVPNVLDLVPGETIRLHVINAGLVVHEAVLGDVSVQDVWETAEAATVGAPPGPTPLVTVPSGIAGLRFVVQSGERVDVTWTVPSDAAEVGAPAEVGVPAVATNTAGAATARPPAWLVGCHIPGHWSRGMQIPIRWVFPGPSGAPATPTR